MSGNEFDEELLYEDEDMTGGGLFDAIQDDDDLL